MKWYQRAWNGIKQGAKNVYKGIVSNTGALAIAGIGLALGIITGGATPIAIAAVVLTVKLVKTGLDAQKAIKTHSLDIENSALVDYATALYVRQKMLDLQPKLGVVSDSLTLLDINQTGNSKPLKYNRSLSRVRKIIEVINTGLDIATVAMNPIKGIHAVNGVKTGIDTVEKVKSGFEVIDSTGKLLGYLDSTKKFTKMLSEHLLHHKGSQEQLVDLINSGRDKDGASYLNIEELRKQTQAIQNDAQALVSVLKEDDFYRLSDAKIQEKFQEHLKDISSKSPLVPKQETMVQKIWHGIKDALNPYSNYNPEVKKHSGLTTAVRKENTEAATKAPVVKTKVVTKDDFVLTARTDTKGKTISAEQRKMDIKCLKEDAKKLDKQIAKKAHDIGEVLHSKDHSQNRIPPKSSGTIRKRSSTSGTRSH